MRVCWQETSTLKSDNSDRVDVQPSFRDGTGSRSSSNEDWNEKRSSRGAWSEHCPDRVYVQPSFRKAEVLQVLG